MTKRIKRNLEDETPEVVQHARKINVWLLSENASEISSVVIIKEFYLSFYLCKSSDIKSQKAARKT